MRKTFIYGLIDPNTNEIRYVGKSVNPENRYMSHCACTYKCRSANWIKSLRPLKPKMIILEVVEKDWIESEQFWIAYFKFLGARLTNITNGGEGTYGRVLSEEVKAKISKSRTGQKQSQEIINKRVQTRNNLTVEQKLEIRRKIRDAILEKAKDPEYIRKLSEAAKRRERVPETKPRKRMSEETKLKMSISAKNRKDRRLTT